MNKKLILPLGLIGAGVLLEVIRRSSNGATGTTTTTPKITGIRENVSSTMLITDLPRINTTVSLGKSLI